MQKQKTFVNAEFFKSRRKALCIVKKTPKLIRSVKLDSYGH